MILHGGTLRALSGKSDFFDAIVFSSMSIASAAAAIKGFLRKLELAQDMATAGAVGNVFCTVLCEADNLLRLVDEELADVDRERHASLFTTTRMLRGRLDHLRGALQSRTRIRRAPANSRPREMPKPQNAVLIWQMYEEHCVACESAGVNAPTPERWVDLIEEMLRP